MTDEPTKMRLKLIQFMKKVPPCINSGSIQRARDFKAFYKDCSKAIVSGNKNEATLRGLLNQWEAYYK